MKLEQLTRKMRQCLQNSRDISVSYPARAGSSNHPLDNISKSALPSFAARDILTQTISTDLLPLHFLSRNGKLPPETLEHTLGCLDEGPVQRFLVIALRRSNPRDNRLGRYGGDGNVDRLSSVEGHVAIFVVMHVNMDVASQGRGRGEDGELVNCAETTVPIVIEQTIFPRRGSVNND